MLQDWSHSSTRPPARVVPVLLGEDHFYILRRSRKQQPTKGKDPLEATMTTQSLDYRYTINQNFLFHNSRFLFLFFIIFTYIYLHLIFFCIVNFGFIQIADWGSFGLRFPPEYIFLYYFSNGKSYFKIWLVTIRKIQI